jgi:hypothetical protein
LEVDVIMILKYVLESVKREKTGEEKREWVVM